MRKSEANIFLETIHKPVVSWLELCYGDKRLSAPCSHGMGYSEEDLKKAGTAHNHKQVDTAASHQPTKDSQD